MSDRKLYAVAGATGNTGSACAESLLERGDGVRVIVRSPEKGEPWKARGAEVAVADLGDTEALTKALHGTDGVYLLTPPDMSSNDLLASRRALIDAMAVAIAESGVPHVVFLSSIGAQHDSGTGIILTAHYGEEKLGALDTPTTFLRASYFAENWAMMAGAVTGDGVLPTMLKADLAIPHVATKDIGATAAEALRAGPRGRRHVIELAGPEDVSANDIAAIYGELTGRAVQVAEIPHEAQVPTAVSFGIPEDAAGLFYEMNRGIEAGRVDWEGGTAVSVRGKVTPREVLSAVVGAGDGR